MGTVSAGTGKVWEIPTLCIPMANPSRTPRSGRVWSGLGPGCSGRVQLGCDRVRSGRSTSCTRSHRCLGYRMLGTPNRRSTAFGSGLCEGLGCVGTRFVRIHLYLQ
jgi:hypothetical protein